jgi:hypothetical protein
MVSICWIGRSSLVVLSAASPLHFWFNLMNLLVEVSGHMANKLKVPFVTERLVVKRLKKIVTVRGYLARSATTVKVFLRPWPTGFLAWQLAF